MMGVMILQKMHDLTDEQNVEQFCFNIQWHFALNITNPGDTHAITNKNPFTFVRTIWENK